MADKYPKYVNQIEQDEHDNSSTPYTKRVQLYGWDPVNLQKVKLTVSSGGILAGAVEGRTLVSVGGTASSSGNNTLVVAGANKTKVYAFSLTTTSTTAVTCIFQSGASGTELWRVTLQAGTATSTGANLAVTPPAWLFATGAATLLNLNLSGAQTVNWSVAYFDEA